MGKKIKKNKYLLLIILLSLLPFLGLLFRNELFHTHDGLVHLARMGAWYKVLGDGQIPPRWAGDLNYGYGTPVLIFMYPWPYFLSSVFLSFGFGLVASFKLVLFLSFLVSGAGMYLFVRSFFNDEKIGFWVALLYQFASFRLVEIITRGAFGEAWSYSFLPFALWGLFLITKGPTFRNGGVVLAAMSTGLLLISHNSISLSFFGVLVLFALIFSQSLVDRLVSLFSLVWGLALSAFYWLPALWERKYTYGDLFMKDLYREHFPSLKQLFWPDLFNRQAGLVHNIPVQIGIFHWLVLLLAGYLWLKGKLSSKEKKIVTFSLVIFLVALFFMQPVSLIFWERIGLLRMFQFSWRLLALVVLVTSLAGFSVFRLWPKRAGYYFPLLAIIIVLSSVSFWLPPEGYDRVAEDKYWNYPLNTTYFGEANTIWAANPPDAFPAQRVQFIEGQGEVVNFQKKSDKQAFSVKADSQAALVSYTYFFPGWRVFIDGVEVPVEFQDPHYRGLITFRLPAGEHQVKIIFSRTKDRRLAEMVSVIALAFWFMLMFKRIINKNHIRPFYPR